MLLTPAWLATSSSHHRCNPTSHESAFEAFEASLRNWAPSTADLYRFTGLSRRACTWIPDALIELQNSG